MAEDPKNTKKDDCGSVAQLNLWLLVSECDYHKDVVNMALLVDQAREKMMGANVSAYHLKRFVVMEVRVSQIK